MKDFDPYTALLVFIAYIIIDVLYALYVVYVGKRQAFAAAVASALLYSLSAYGVVTFSKNILYVIPLATGAFLGTYLTVRFKK
jgi:hypothetical protein